MESVHSCIFKQSCILSSTGQYTKKPPDNQREFFVYAVLTQLSEGKADGKVK
jgi:hypothetical protein